MKELWSGHWYTSLYMIKPHSNDKRMQLPPNATYNVIKLLNLVLIKHYKLEEPHVELR